METIFCPNEEYTRTKFYGSRTKARCVGCPCADICIYKADVEAKILERNKHYLQTSKNVRVMTENQELKMQLLDKFANIEKPETVDFCKAAFDWLTEEPEKVGCCKSDFDLLAEELQPQGSAVVKNSKPDGFYLVFENGESIQYNPIYRGEIVSDSPVKYVGIKWGDRSLKVALHDQAAGEDITLTASEDKAKGYKRYIDNYLNAVADWNGKENTEHLKAIGLNEEIKLEDGEYIPALGEMYFIYLNRKGLNEILEQIGGEPIADDWFWTSTEYSAAGAWYLYLGSGRAYYYAKASITYRVRAVSAFIC